MSRKSPTALGRDLVTFFGDFLPAQQTKPPYDPAAIVMHWRPFLALRHRGLRRTVTRLDVHGSHRRPCNSRFLVALESERSNGIANRKARLGRST